MRPEEIDRLAVPTSPVLRGDLLLVAVTRPDLENNSYTGGLHRIATDGQENHPVGRWTHGYRDTAPTVSPDGRWVAFLRATGSSGEQARPQLYVIPVDGGEARRLTEAPLGVADPAWAPDSRRIAFTARIPEPGRYGSAPAPGTAAPEPPAEAPRRITRLDYRLDDLGFRADRRARLFVVDAFAGAGPVELTDGRADVAAPAWLPDGRHIVVTAARDWGERETDHVDLYAVPADGGEAVLAVRTRGDAALPTVTGAGEVVFLGAEFAGNDVVAHNTGLWLATPNLEHSAEPGTPRRLTDVETIDCERAAGRPVVTSRGVLVGIRNRGAVELRSVPLDAEGIPLADTAVIVGERGVVKGFAVDTTAGDRVAAVVSTPDSPGEVVLWEGADADREDPARVGWRRPSHGVDEEDPARVGWRRPSHGVAVLTDFAAPLREAGLRPVQEVTGRSPDGYESHGWVVLPEGEGPHPVLLHVHGGPFAYHGWGFFDEAQVYASAGYAVVLPNPRGSAGYGERHGRAIIGAFGTVDVDDVLSVLDAALALPECDATRVGVMGGSYGGFMTSWLSAHHGGRFRAAWSERAVNAWDSFTGSSDIGYRFTDAYLGEDPEGHVRMSPLTYAGQIRIPFAVVHSEQDWRCPLEQAQRMFVALRRAGVDAEMLIFPGEGHELTRSGQPRHRHQRFDAVLEWWARHL